MFPPDYFFMVLERLPITFYVDPALFERRNLYHARQLDVLLHLRHGLLWPAVRRGGEVVQPAGALPQRGGLRGQRHRLRLSVSLGTGGQTLQQE